MFFECAQSAAIRRKYASGKAVVNRLLSPASAPVLSDPVGNLNTCCLVGIKAWHVCINAICAMVSKQLMYCWAGLVMKGQVARTLSICHVSANHATSVDVIIQPPIPATCPSAHAPAAAWQIRLSGMARGHLGLWLRQCFNH